MNHIRVLVVSHLSLFLIYLHESNCVRWIMDSYGQYCSSNDQFDENAFFCYWSFLINRLFALSRLVHAGFILLPLTSTMLVQHWQMYFLLLIRALQTNHSYFIWFEILSSFDFIFVPIQVLTWTCFNHTFNQINSVQGWSVFSKFALDA